MTTLELVNVHGTVLARDSNDWFWWYCTECYGFKISQYEIAGTVNACSFCYAPANYQRDERDHHIKVMPPGLNIDAVYAAYNLGGINAARPIVYQHLWGAALLVMGKALCAIYLPRSTTSQSTLSQL